MPGRHLPPDHAKGDERTLGGYAAVHARPAAFEGADGMAYSVEIMIDATGDAGRPFGAYLLFPRWRRIGASGVEGHVESEFLRFGATADEARRAAEAMELAEAKATLDALIRRDYGGTPQRRWYDVVRDGDARDDEARDDATRDDEAGDA